MPYSWQSGVLDQYNSKKNLIRCHASDILLYCTLHDYILGSAISASRANQLQTQGYEWYQGPGQQGKVRESKLSIRGCPKKWWAGMKFISFPRLRYTAESSCRIWHSDCLMCIQWLIYTTGEGRDLHVSLIFLGQAGSLTGWPRKILFKAKRRSYFRVWMYTQASTHLSENVNPPDWYTHGNYKEIMGINNKFPDFTLWRRSNSNLHVCINGNNMSSNYASWHGKPFFCRPLVLWVNWGSCAGSSTPTYQLNFCFEQAYKCMTVQQLCIDWLKLKIIWSNSFMLLLLLYKSV